MSQTACRALATCFSWSGCSRLSFSDLLLSRRWTPVDQNSDRRRRAFDDGRLDQEALSVSVDGELIADRIDNQSRVEQRPRNASIDGRLDSQVHGHDPAVEPQVEKLL